MEFIESISGLRARLSDERCRALVPTMGALHAGHLSLIDAARTAAGGRATVIMSVFVNPLQFGPGEDFTRYPRDIAADRAKASDVDILFAPGTEELYPQSGAPPIRVIPELEPPRWEAAIRPGHFAGVLTVVAKLFNIVQPQIAVFGQKDIQQATYLRAMVQALDFPIRIIVAPIIREPDGLAMSSRNVYLSTDERARALALSRALAAANDQWKAGERTTAALEAAGKAVLEATPGVEIDYFAVAEPKKLEPVGEATAGSVVMVAARVGRTRLLDNLILGQ
ncbi:MAG TPA: pantoate--beta-alanine ligase [Gemmatimonadaceae bacterium]|nr:pantoate--beta-alanine ligase [Gemmatimonadaceae bacterium]